MASSAHGVDAELSHAEWLLSLTGITLSHSPLFVLAVSPLQVFKTLPPLLIFNLKRFELNYEASEQNKKKRSGVRVDKANCVPVSDSLLFFFFFFFFFFLSFSAPQTMRTFKINDRLEFPMVLNMKPYSKEGIAEIERAAKGAVATNGPGGVAEADADAHGDDYYEYELSGVTVHTGSMDRGE